MCRSAYSMTITPNKDVDLIFTNVPIKFQLLDLTQFE